MKKNEVSIQSMGGRARAKAMSPEDRVEIARAAAQTRWAKRDDEADETGAVARRRSIPRATHGAEDRPLRIGAIEIPCYVLDDGRRVIIQRGMLTALDMSQGTAGRGGGDRVAKFIASKSIKSYVPKQLADVIIEPIRFRTPTGSDAYGYEATILADLCDAVLDARKLGSLNYQQDHIAERCEILVRGFARVGIIALVDEATGYQDERDRDALHRILEAYISKELLPWARRFPNEFYKEMFRLRGWTLNATSASRGPRYAGKLTNQLVYERLPPRVLDELRSKNPADEHGQRRYKHHQFLTTDIGHPHLEKHVASVTALMRASTDWTMFDMLFKRAFPQKGDQIPLAGSVAMLPANSDEDE